MWVREFAIGLVVPCEGVDYSPLQKPVDIIKFNPRQRDFESDKKYVENRLPELEEIYVKSANCLADKYDRLIKQADRQFSQKTYTEARNTYQQALDIMPKQAYPKKKIAEIDALLAKQQNDENRYEETVRNADALMAQGQYAEALAQYKAAAALNPQETYSAQKINEIQALLTKQQAEKQTAAAADAKYNDLMAKAGQANAQKNYEAAKQYYQEALAIKPAESAPKTRIREIDSELEKQKQQQARQQSVDDAYQAAIAEADALFRAKQYDAAKEAYAKALAIKPSESYPRTRTQEVDKAREQQAMAEQNAKAASLNRSLESYLDEGDRQFKAKQYEDARAAYAKALEIKPNEGYARQRINSIDKLLAADQAANEKAQAAEQAAREKALAEEQAAKEKALALEQAAKEKALAEEQAAREKALAAEQAAKEKALAEDRAAQERALAAERAAKEKALAEQAAKEKALAAELAAKQKAAEEGYKNAITLANSALTQKQYAAAREQYQKALGLKPDDAFAKGKIAEVDRLIDEENKKLAADELRNRQYREAIAGADKQYQAKDFEGAVVAYRKALDIKPGDAYARQRITGIENVLAADKAAKQKAVEEGYNNTITQANAALAQKQYSQAKEQYQKALAFKPEDPFARAKINEVDLLIKQEQERMSAEQARKKQYEEAVARADKLLASKDYGNARLAFGDALQAMPGEAYPKQKISEIDKMLEEQQKALAEKQARDKAFDEAVKNGDRYYSLKNYNDAKVEYNKALSVKPGETYPKNRISEIDGLVRAEQKALADAKAKEDAYNSAVSSGNSAYSQKKYAEAKGFYNQAIRIRPNDAYAKDQIALIDNLLAEQEKQLLAEQAKKKQYDDFIALGDKAFDGNNYTVAKENYQKALEVIPGSPYPKQKIARIDEIYKLLAQQKTQNAQQTAPKTSGKQSIASAAPLVQLVFKNDAERDTYLNELKRKYPEGITVEIYKEQYRETRRYIVIRDNVAGEFRDVLIKTYGGHEYTMNGKTVTQMYFESQTKSRPGEYFNETVFE